MWHRSIFPTANARDAFLHLTQQTAGNGVVTSQSFDPLTGRLTGTSATSAGGLQSDIANLGYTYDVLGNLTQRADGNQGVTESLVYDQLNRLTQASLNIDGGLSKSFAYDAIGNLLSKSDVGTYTYPAAGGALPHAVQSIAGATINTSFTYDANGNQLTGNNNSFTWTSFNMPASITQGTSTLAFSYDPEHGRLTQTAPEGTTLYLSGLGMLVEQFASASGVVQWNNYLFAGSEMVGVRFERSDGTTAVRYFTKDHLGSVAVLTDETGNVVERNAYDPWGKRRFANGEDDPAGSISSQTTRGFTSQEELADVGLVHLNGRVYDPTVGRFVSADPLVSLAYDTQGWNRYAYVGNNPLTFTDPSGYCFLGLCHLFNSIGHFFDHVARSVGSFLRQNPIIGDILEIAAIALCPETAGLTCTVPVAFAATATISGLESGKLGVGLKAGLIAAVTAGAFYEVGEITGHTPAFGKLEFFENVAGHALVGCASAEASGGSCGPGALSAGVSAFAGPIINGKNVALNVVANATLGGIASVAGGGKFANGAVTSAFGYLFNFRSNSILRAVVPGQVVFDDAVTALEKGDVGGAALGFLRLGAEDLLTVLTLGTVGFETAAVRTSVAAEGGLTAVERVDQLAQGGLSQIQRERFVTLGVTETQEGIRVISSSSKTLEQSVIDLLQEGEVGVSGVGHAEVTGVGGARSLGLTPTGVAASRPICPSCASYLGEQGITPLTPLK